MSRSTDARTKGVSLRLFLADGSPNGLRIVEKSNWSGVAVTCSKSRYVEVRQREEFNGAGVYLLTGPSETDASMALYIGEADVARDRIDAHVRTKDFWENLVLFTSKDRNLNKAHVKYLESRLVEIAQEAKRADLLNGNAPKHPVLSEADTADAEAFLEDILLICPLLGISAFEIPAARPSGMIILSRTAKGLTARGYENSEGFVVLKGSEGPTQAVPSTQRYVLQLRDQLLRNGVLKTDGERVTLTKDYLFDSASTAAAVMLGRSANGRVEWRAEDGRTLKEIQEEVMKATPS